MAVANAHGVEIEYEAEGPEGGPLALLIMGLACQLTFWPTDFVEALAGAGYRVLRFDNRDIGKSHKFHQRRAPNPLAQTLAVRLGFRGLAPYSLEDMARDATGLLDALGIEKAHLVGVSMGGMIAQIVAASAPARIKSLTAIMSSTNNPELPRARAEVARALMARPRPGATKEEILERAMVIWGLIGTKQSGSTNDELRARLAAEFERSHYPAGPRRQLAAIIETGDLRRFARAIAAPTLVIHGSEDPLAPPAGGADIAATIKGARLEIIDGMAHDIPKKFLPRISAMVIEHMNRAEAAAKAAEAA